MMNIQGAFVEGEPTSLALVAGHERLTYAELDRRSGALASYLRARRLGVGSYVGVYAGRTAEAVVAMVGVMRTGAAYTLFEAGDVSQSTIERLRSINYGVILAASEHVGTLRAQGLEACAIREAEEHPFEVGAPPPAGGDDAAYVLFTSGSTGQPKGVSVSRRNIAHYLAAIRERLGVSRQLAYAHVSTLAADLGNTSIFLALSTGGTLHLLDDNVRKDPRAFWAYLGRERVDVLKMTPSHWRLMLEAAKGGRSRAAPFEFLVLGGEALSVTLARETFASGATKILVNHYGPTETTIGVTVNVLRGETSVDVASPTVPIGRPLGQTRLLVRTEGGDFQAASATGELYIGGPSVARGYVGNPGATAERFRSDVEGDERFYRTGDWVRLSASGTAEFLGRIDRQVKIQGHRVELEHIEALLRRQPGVLAALAMVSNANDRTRLVAAVVLDAATTVKAVKSALRDQLPAAIVPSAIVRFATFAMNENGKIDVAEMQRLLARALEGTDEPSRLDVPEGADGLLMSEVVATWERYLGARVGSLDDNFYDLGGDSMTAIQVISALQRKGYWITSGTFLRGLTVRANMEAIRAGQGVQQASGSTAFAGGGALSAAQRRFFEQEFAQPNHWSQAILLQLESPLERSVVEQAILALCEAHSVLRARFVRADGAWRCEPARATKSPLTWTTGPSDNPAALHDHIYSTSERVIASIDLDGALFKAHLFELKDQPAELLLVCHHLAVDAVSWHTLVGELGSLSYAFARGDTAAVVPPSLPLQAWAAHIQRSRDALCPDIDFWNQMFLNAAPAKAPSARDGNHERDARTLWFTLTREQTASLEVLPGVNMSAAILGSFIHAWSSATGTQTHVVEVESHGRKSMDDGVDVSRSIGWFTSAFPLVLTVDEGSSSATIARAERAIAGVPNLGIAYGLFEHDPRLVPGAKQVAPLCYNFLGRFGFAGDDSHPFAASRHRIAPVRGPENERIHELKLTGRILDGQLIVDLSYSSRLHEAEELSRVMQSVAHDLRELGGSGHTAPNVIVAEEGSNTGLLTCFPVRLDVALAAPARAHYAEVLLTGATGFLGIHLLRQLLHRTQAHVWCLVRSGEEGDGWQRLASRYEWYFEGESLVEFKGRVSVLDGSLDGDDFSLPESVRHTLGQRLDAIYHLGANTRLFGDDALVTRENTQSVSAALALASAWRPKDLHYMSTLAVSGVNARPELVAFSEQALDIGQRHQNAYELSKFQSELLLRRAKLDGARVFVYRAGNVSGHSRTGRFQWNASSNRLVQLLRALAKVGHAPKFTTETIALTPVDGVIDAVLSISRSATPAGVFHVDACEELGFQSIFAGLRECGVSLKGSSLPTIREVLQAHGDPRDPVVALGMFWANRENRNVRYDNAQTLRFLRANGFEFPLLDERWLQTFLRGLAERGIFTS